MVTSVAVQPDTARRAGLARGLAAVGLGGAVLAGAAEIVMHLLPGGRRLDPLTATLSAYALEPVGWLFSASVLLLAGASALVGTALLSRQVLRPRRPWAVWYLLWIVGLVGLTLITKTTIGPNDSVQSRIHWSFTLLAFVALPLAVLCMLRDTRTEAGTASSTASESGPGAASHTGPGATSVPKPLAMAWKLARWGIGWLLLLAVQSGLTELSLGGVFPWAGLLERGVATTELAAVVCLGWWAAGAPRPVAARDAERAVPAARPHHPGVLDALEDGLDALGGRFDALGGRFDALGGRFDALGGRFDALGGGFDPPGGSPRRPRAAAMHWPDASIPD